MERPAAQRNLSDRPVTARELEPARLDAAVAARGGTFLGTTNRGNPTRYPVQQPDGTWIE